jgi:hypothetical protein
LRGGRNGWISEELFNRGGGELFNLQMQLQKLSHIATRDSTHLPQTSDAISALRTGKLFGGENGPRRQGEAYCLKDDIKVSTIGLAAASPAVERRGGCVCDKTKAFSRLEGKGLTSRSDMTRTERRRDVLPLYRLYLMTMMTVMAMVMMMMMMTTTTVVVVIGRLG